MATDAENIATIKTNTLTKLAALSDPATAYITYVENGKKMNWVEYQKFLQEQVAWCDQQLAATEPFEIITYGVPGRPGYYP